MSRSHIILVAVAALIVGAIGVALVVSPPEDAATTAATSPGSAGNVEGPGPVSSITVRSVAGNTPDPSRVVSTEAVADAYGRYQVAKPAGEPELSFDDAYIRAWLACALTSEWPAGSVDAVLIDAYRPLFGQFPDWGC